MGKLYFYFAITHPTKNEGMLAVDRMVLRAGFLGALNHCKFNPNRWDQNLTLAQELTIK